MTNDCQQNMITGEIPGVNDCPTRRLDYCEQGFMCSINQSLDDINTFFGYIRLSQNHPLWAKSVPVISTLLGQPVNQVELVATGYWIGFKITSVNLGEMEERVAHMVQKIAKYSPSDIFIN